MKFKVLGSIVIDADPSKIWPHIKDFSKWPTWSPWTIIEPDHKQTVEGNVGKIGHKMTWDGKVIGSGEMTITKSDDKRVDYKLEFLRPNRSKSTTYFEIEDMGGKTKVTWGMDGNLPWFLFWMKKMMQSWIEMDYERGLKMLKEVIEKGSIEATTTNEGMKAFEGFGYVGLKQTASMEEMPEKMSALYKRMMKDLKENGIKAKHWVTIYTKVHMPSKTFTYIAAVSDEDMQGKSLGNDYVTGNIPSTNMFEVKHKGSYRFLGNAWSMANMNVYSRKDLKPKGKPFEYYHNDPTQTEEKELLTSIYFPVK